MSYKTQYGKCRFDTREKKNKGFVIPVFLGMFVVLILLRFAFPAQVASLRKTVFPFLEPYVQQSFAEMTESIRSGTSFEDAAAVFCKDILREGSR